MDAFSGYNKIKLEEEDQDDIEFITHKGVVRYKVVPFGLLNVGATSQCTMDIIFGLQIGRNIQVYVDDIIAMSLISFISCEGSKKNIRKGKSSQQEAKPYKMLLRIKWRKIYGVPLNS